jgi:membrane protein DedA with SNARE-associated domain
MFEHWMDSIGDSVGAWFYLIAAFCCYAEAAFLAGLIFPAEAALLVAGVFCERDVLSLPWMIVIAFVCAVAGDSTGYEFGRKFGPGLRSSKLGQRIGEKRWLIVDEFLHRHGGKAVFFGRLTALLRAMVPSMAGMSRMPYKTFLFWNVLGGAVWAPGSVLLGYAFSTSLGTVSRTMTGAPFVLLVIVGGVAYLIHRRSKKTEEKLLAAAEHDPELANNEV